MKADEAKNLARSLAKLFPGSMANEEQARACAREFMKYDAAHVRRAIDDHHRTREFISFPELYKACAEVPLPTAPTTRQSIPPMTFAQVIRQQWPELEKRKDAEVVLRFWRADWHRYKQDSDQRLASILRSIEGGRFAKMMKDRGHSDDFIAASQQRVMDMHERQENGYRDKVRNGCTSGLVGTGMTMEDAASWAEACFSDADYFRTALADLRGDIFATSPAP